MQKSRRQTGFTLIELLIVVAIIAILALIAVLTNHPRRVGLSSIARVGNFTHQHRKD